MIAPRVSIGYFGPHSISLINTSNDMPFPYLLANDKHYQYFAILQHPLKSIILENVDLLIEVH